MTASKCNKLGMGGWNQKSMLFVYFVVIALKRYGRYPLNLFILQTVRFVIFETKLTIIIIIINSPRSSCRKRAYTYWLFWFRTLKSIFIKSLCSQRFIIKSISKNCSLHNSSDIKSRFAPIWCTIALVHLHCVNCFLPSKKEGL